MMTKNIFLGLTLLGCGEKPAGTGERITDPASDEETAPDADGDGLSDEQEASFGSDPNNPDTDGDGLDKAQIPTISLSSQIMVAGHIRIHNYK